MNFRYRLFSRFGNMKRNFQFCLFLQLAREQDEDVTLQRLSTNCPQKEENKIRIFTSLFRTLGRNWGIYWLVSRGSLEALHRCSREIRPVVRFPEIGERGEIFPRAQTRDLSRMRTTRMNPWRRLSVSIAVCICGRKAGCDVS